MTTRDEHIQRCKTMALQQLDDGDTTGALVSFLSNLRNCSPDDEDEITLMVMAADSSILRAPENVEDVRRWINGFGSNYINESAMTS